MEKILPLLQILVPILTCIGLGIIAKRKQLITPEQNRGVQQFVLKFCIPCVLFNSCMQASVGIESLTTMVALLPVLLLSTLWGFHARKKRFPYHNLPNFFAANETGMLGIPLCILLFGANQAYRMGMLDMAQGLIGIPVMVILSVNTGKEASIKEIIKNILLSPLFIMSILGLSLGLSGVAVWLDQIGVGQIIKETTTLLSQPVSAAMLFSIGFNFSLEKEKRKEIFKIAGIKVIFSAAACLVMQGVLCLIPEVDTLTRWVVLLYCVLPGSYLTPSLGRNENENTIASGACSMLTVLTLISICVIAVFYG